MNNPIIDINNLSFQYNRGPLILEEVSLQVYEKDFLGVIGPNGGGKSTLIKLIIGLLSPTLGTITVFEKKPSIVRSHIGYVAQFTTFFRDFPITVKQTILMGRLGKTRLFGPYSKEDERIARELLEHLGIADLEKSPISSLSGGQLQRVLIGRALASEPSILLLDEPSASTDPRSEENIFDLLKRLNEEITILVVSHDIGFISHYITRVACINKRLVCHKTEEITPEILKEIYEGDIRAIPHHRVEER